MKLLGKTACIFMLGAVSLMGCRSKAPEQPVSEAIEQVPTETSNAEGQGVTTSTNSASAQPAQTAQPTQTGTP